MKCLFLCFNAAIFPSPPLSAFDSTAGRYFAIKITDMDNVSDNFRLKFIPRERKVWRQLNPPNTVRLYNDFKKSGYLFEIIELAVGGDMASASSFCRQIF